MARLFALLQYLIPQHLLSRLVGRLADSRIGWIKNSFIRLFHRIYGLNMAEALEPEPTAYPSFNAFFTRALKPGARPIDPDPTRLVCPADGAVSQLGPIDYGRIFQAKGHSYSLTTLIGGDVELAKEFQNGQFATIYLSPKDYHRVHMPVDGRLRQMIYVPGDLFSVNNATVSEVPNLFARNERLVAIFDTAQGPMAMILVGAMIVAGIETVWAGQVAPKPRSVERVDYTGNTSADPIVLAKGDEMGRFKLGSTVILLFGEDQIEWLQQYGSGTATRLGEPLAQSRAPKPDSDQTETE
ncbi:phosphatidylserine decarboxylase [Motiliproteus coralliicola]|uniref:Phosphatidylserine decarboxylase proenzyme n=1 Tax=Motiliproteus coralliicola TaxID=2283196 RepID=A0A369WE84_9GAMM|nr:archaetidylserine decarboxylase [Motiliproteus coralliicola]RDE19641.1 phosphatidylserine decarboxylase [Motiliproteus coralliicola]